MTKQQVITDKAPKAIGPYSQAIKTQQMVFCSGQIAIDPSTQEFKSSLTVEQQTTRALDNLREVLTASGTSLNQVVKTTIFLTNLDDFKAVNTLYETYFQAPYPARSTVEVSALPLGAKVEFEAIAIR